MDLNFEVRKQIISRTDKEKVVNLSENYLRLCFTFKTDDWNGLTKFALFKHDTGTTRIGLVEDMVVVPSSLLSGDRLVFSIYGLDTPNDTVYRITTNLVRLYLLNSGYTSDVDDPLPPEPVDIVEEIYIAIGTKADAVHTHTKTEITDLIIDLKPTEDDRIDLDDYIDYGLYRVTDSRDCPYVDNFPNTGDGRDYGFLLEVTNGINPEVSEPCKQTLTIADADNPRIFYRVLREWVGPTYSMYKWSEWCEISKTGHTHTINEIADLKQTLSGLKKLFLNRLIVGSINDTIQSDETADLTAQLIENGVPTTNTTIYFYKEIEEE